jgi:TonB family protein
MPSPEWTLPQEPDTTPIYSAKDADIVPPSVVRSQRLDALGFALQGDERVTIEVLITEEGTVDTAHAVHAPRTLGESLFLANALHAVKSWHFSPATKNHVPVAYRMVLTFDAPRK